MSGRAALPDRTGSVERAGVPLVFDVYGEGNSGPTVLLMPTWSIVHARVWKAQVGSLSRHFRVVTFDGRGNGRSGRPAGPAAYADRELTEDALAVLDATGTAAAVLVALSAGNRWALRLAAEHPDRVRGLFAIAPACGFARSDSGRELYRWLGEYDEHPGWAKYNRRYWLEGGLTDFREYFFGQVFSEPHSTKQIEDALEWSSGITAQTLVDTVEGPEDDMERICADVRCPVHVLHGTDDRIRSFREGERLAELTHGSLTLLEGAGHSPNARQPVRTNLLINRRRGVRVRGYVPELHRHLAACDLAVVQGGLTTCMELTAARRPFLYVPLRDHFEQNFHVRHRLERYGAGRCLPYDQASDPGTLAEAMAKELRSEVQYLPVETAGAARAAAMLAELL